MNKTLKYWRDFAFSLTNDENASVRILNGMIDDAGDEQAITDKTDIEMLYFITNQLLNREQKKNNKMVCSYAGCKNKYDKNGYCSKHLYKANQSKNVNKKSKKEPSTPKICKYEGCNENARCLGFCHYHYGVQYRNSETHKIRKKIRLDNNRQKALLKKQEKDKIEKELKDIINSIPRV